MTVFACSGVILPVASSVLGETVLFAADNAVVSVDERRTVYRAAELVAIAKARPTADELRRIHEVKRLFGGRVVGVHLREGKGEEARRIA